MGLDKRGRKLRRAVLRWMWVVGLGAIGMGCTATALQHSTGAHASTFSDIVIKVALDNLAMFVENPGAIPAQIVITQGSITVSDQANPSFTYNWPAIARTLGISGSRTWEESWSVVPVTSFNELNTLRHLYAQCASGHALDGEVAKAMLGHDLKDIEKLSGCSSWLESGPVPGGFPSGHHGKVFVWVRAGQAEAFGDFVMQVMQVAGTAPKQQSFTFPGAIVPPRP